jgi:phospholipase C
MSAPIEHVVVLMLENRSFDCMLGMLYPNDPDYQGLTGQESNLYGGRPIPIWNDTGMLPATACIPKPDPGELFKDISVQLFGGTGQPAGLSPPMSGFAQNYMAQPPSKDGPYDPRAVMHYFSPAQVPVISTLAKAFGVCDQWYASAPCQTWPNRFFAHTATSLGHVDNSTFPIPFPANSLFRRLEDKGKSWRVYFHDMPQSSLLRDIWLYAVLHFRLFNQFLADAHTGALPNYSFIEPRYFTDLFLSKIPNDEHPPHNVVYGEQLIAAVYNAVRSSPCWKRTLLVITYDEHGGCYDHLSPPPAVPPDANHQYGFAFGTYGVRVPAVIVSPYVPAGSKIRAVPPESLGQAGSFPFDHTSIIATVRELFSLGDALTARDGVAPHLLSALSLAVPTNDGPERIDPAPAEPLPPQLIARAAQPPNGMQGSLSAAAAALPLTPPTSEQDIPPSAPPTRPPLPTVATAGTDAMARVRLFIGAT